MWSKERNTKVSGHFIFTNWSLHLKTFSSTEILMKCLFYPSFVISHFSWHCEGKQTKSTQMAGKAISLNRPKKQRKKGKCHNGSQCNCGYYISNPGFAHRFYWCPRGNGSDENHVICLLGLVLYLFFSFQQGWKLQQHHFVLLKFNYEVTKDNQWYTCCWPNVFVQPASASSWIL